MAIIIAIQRLCESESAHIFAHMYTFRYRLNPSFISVCSIRSVNSDFACTRRSLRISYFTCATPWKSLVFLCKVPSKRETSSKREKALALGTYEARRIAWMGSREKKLYQINITIWCVKPIAINAYSELNFRPFSIPMYLLLNLLNSIENRISMV